MNEPASPITVVTTFLDLLASKQADSAVDMLSEDVEWRNTGLPTVRGRRVGDVLREMERRGVAFSADMRHIAADGDAVLTERTDYLRYRHWVADFWVCGTFVVRDGRITLWDDHYAPGSVLAGAVRGLLGLVRG